MEGPLSKWTNMMQGWQYRWFVLDENNGILSYYTSKEKMNRGQRRGCVRLKGAVIGIEDEDDSAFTITVDQKVFHFQARDPEERENWMRALEMIIHRHSGYYRPHRKFNKLTTRTEATTTVNTFERKIQEADKYLQLMIDQVKYLAYWPCWFQDATLIERCFQSIEHQIDNCQEEKHKESLQPVLDSSNAMLDTVKHTIVVLQLAKNQLVPIDGIPLTFHRSRDSSHSRSRKGKAPVQNGSEIPGNSRNVVVSNSVGPRSFMPVTSYSSDEDSGEESWIDAKEQISSDDDQESLTDDTPGVDGVRPKVPIDPGSIFTEPEPEFDDDDVDFDALYEDRDENDLGNVQEHGSVIYHLLSQVSIGMDLTKIPLPTFILERRSLLEMFSDFFAHPDLFVGITDYTTPEQRMIGVVRWYLSSFHAGRQSSVAKKPYNPIIGETFHCYWDVPNTQTDERPVENGPFPNARADQLTFMAEQVSHHPPVTAFYAEHPGKRVLCNAHIWTKSKFLGLSIGVHMVGQGCISLLEHGEEYIATFPSGYGRSILTTPWIEMGGKVKVSCEKTGYYANISFLTKPFYGGKPHCLIAELYRPEQKSSFMTIKGEWNGVMMERVGKDDDKPFLNVNEMLIHPKRCAQISEQGEFESRRMWRHVTGALKRNDIRKASDGKHWLEQRQRHGHKHRAATGEKWKTNHFEEVGEHWVFKRPLQSRQVL